MKHGHACCRWAWCAFLLAASGYAGRPLTVDDADPVEAGLFEAEGGAAYARDPACKHWDLPLGLTYGALPGVEVGLGFGGQFESRDEWLEEKENVRHVHEDGFGDLFLAAKWRFAEEGAWLPRQALVPSVKLPTADEAKGLGSGEADYDLTWIASKALTERWGLHLNAGYTWIGDPAGERFGNVVHTGVATDYQLADALQAVAEVFTEDELDRGGGLAVLANAGVRWQVAESLVLDLAAGSRLCGDGTPDFTATAGLTWTFGFGKPRQ